MPESLRTANHLAAEPGPYLRSAAHQPVHWYPWSDEAFAVAKSENKPILLDIGAVWCHWCHVMDTESYENPSTAELINKYFVPIKVDRDERPDVDARYQTAVGAISGQGGWPLTAFLTPDGRVFFGGTYFPPEDRYGRPGFPNLLKLLADAYQREPDKIYHNAEHITRAVQERHDLVSPSSDLSLVSVSHVVETLVRSFDEKHGGFSTAPKFPNTSAIELLLATYDEAGDPGLLDVVVATLRHMGRGGIHDRLAGGFHRYSTDEEWLVPHFEKMLYDNAGLLVNYVHAFQATSEYEFRDVAEDIIKFIHDALSDQKRGGFFSSQDADVEAGDDGSYFTWSEKELRDILNADEFECIQLFSGVTPAGHMHGGRGQNIFHQDMEFAEVAKSVGRTPSEVAAIIKTAETKMASVRQERKAPFVDTTVYADWNGLMIHAYLEASKAFERSDLLEFARRSLDRVLSEHLKQDGTISHRELSVAEEAFLADQVEVTNACLDTYEVTTERKYLEQAERIMLKTIELFGDSRGGFFDAARSQAATGLLSVGMRPIQDSPTASPNAVAISVLNRLWVLTGNEEFRNRAQQSLEYFSGWARDYGMYASHYFLSLREFLTQPPHVAVMSRQDDERGRELFHAALTTYRPGKLVTFCRPEEFQHLPEELKGVLKSSSRATAYVCSQFSCSPPAFTREALNESIKSFGRNRPVHDSGS